MIGRHCAFCRADLRCRCPLHSVPHLTPSAALDARLVRDPEIMGGEAVFRGTRVPLRVVLATLAEGKSVEEVVADFPTITADDVRAVIAFAAASAEDDLPVRAVPTRA